ncbi:HNH endonuclease signature motif containing protein [Microbacterium schleiferi]|uniref:HNH endonuclease signature motif containing protein n=1 Tax=Microbacterium schleiferi TaxID=69362 RepID=UPI00311E1B9E
MGHDANTTVGGRWRALDALITELEDAHRAVAEAQAREARLFAAALDLALERAAEQHAAGLRRRSHADLPLREVAAEIGAALRLSDRAVQRRMGDASTTVTDYPDVLTSWEHGKIDAAHVAAILDAGTGISPDLRARYETCVLAAAETESAGRLKSIARIIAARVDPEAAARRQRAAKADRHIRVIDLPDDMARLIADLPATLIYAIYDRLTCMAKGVPDTPDTAAPDTASTVPLLVDGSEPDAATDSAVDEQRNGNVVRVRTGPAGDARGDAELHDITPERHVVDTRTMDQKRADLLADMLLAAAPVAHGAGLDAIRGEVAITVPVLTLAGVGNQPALLAGYGPIDAETARRLAANAPGWDRVMTDPYTGAVLGVDRYRKNKDLEQYLRARDERCRCPGCVRLARGTDVDHTVDAARGGPTEHTNLAHLCRRHHTLKHETAWRVKQLPGGILEWTSPTGRTHRDRPPGVVTFVPDATITAILNETAPF